MASILISLQVVYVLLLQIGIYRYKLHVIDTCVPLYNNETIINFFELCEIHKLKFKTFCLNVKNPHINIYLCIEYDICKKK